MLTGGAGFCHVSIFLVILGWVLQRMVPGPIWLQWVVAGRGSVRWGVHQLWQAPSSRVRGSCACQFLQHMSLFRWLVLVGCKQQLKENYLVLNGNPWPLGYLSEPTCFGFQLLRPLIKKILGVWKSKMVYLGKKAICREEVLDPDRAILMFHNNTAT